MNDVFYASAPMSNELYVLDLEMPVFNINVEIGWTKWFESYIPLALLFKPYRWEAYLQAS